MDVHNLNREWSLYIIHACHLWDIQIVKHLMHFFLDPSMSFYFNLIMILSNFYGRWNQDNIWIKWFLQNKSWQSCKNYLFIQVFLDFCENSLMLFRFYPNSILKILDKTRDLKQRRLQGKNLPIAISMQLFEVFFFQLFVAKKNI